MNRYFNNIAKRLFPTANEKDSKYIANTLFNICIGIFTGVATALVGSLY